MRKVFGKPRPYERSEAVSAGDAARAKGKKKKAVAEYQKVIDHDPLDEVVQGKIAPLLADLARRDEAWKSFLAAADGHAKKGFADRALAVLTQAAGYFPREAEVWERMAKLHAEKGRKADAVKSLLDGSRNFRSKTLRPLATQLLRRALEVEPLNVPVTVDLAKLLRAEGHKHNGVAALEALALKVNGAERRRVRRALFGMTPTPANLWRWIRA